MASRVFIISNQAKIASTLQSIIEEQSMDLIGTASQADEARQKLQIDQADLIIVNTPFSREIGYQLVRDLSYIQPDAGFIVLAKDDQLDIMNQRLANICAFVLTKPINKSTLLLAIQHLEKSRYLLNQLREKNFQLEQKIEDIKIISRAKHVLMQHLNMTELQAHDHIQKQAMDLRLSQRKIAENILKTYEF